MIEYNESIEKIVSILIITSPSPCHPSLYLIKNLLDSLVNLPELANSPIIVVLDGFVLSNEIRTKVGRINSTMADAYEKYFIDLTEYMKSDFISRGRLVIIERLKSHCGFGLSVKRGLEICQSKYCLICQHDRVFLQTFNHVGSVIQLMEDNAFIRYVGFATSTSVSHNSVMKTRYQLDALLEDDMIIKIPNTHNQYLHPLIYWYDSQHLCHVERYLNIFRPFRTFPIDFKAYFEMKMIQDMIIRKGDFIEDRFGQMQRRMIVELNNQSISKPLVKNFFRWFGSYIIFSPSEVYEKSMSNGELVSETIESSDLIGYRANTMVGHMKGRQYDPVKLLSYMKECDSKQSN